MPKLVLDGILSAFCAAAELCSKDDGVPSATKKKLQTHFFSLSWAPLFIRLQAIKTLMDSHYFGRKLRGF